MTIGAILLVLLVVLAVGSGAYWIITKFFAEPVRMVALTIVGVLLLLFLLSQFWPDAANYRLWR